MQPGNMTNGELIQRAYIAEATPTERVLAARLALALDYISVLEIRMEQHDVLPERVRRFVQ